MEIPLVSIIIPVYNAEKYLNASILSAMKQTWPNIEIIIVDDGSKDSSLQIARSLENNIIKVFSQENKGASAARNYGLKEAKGKYIQFLDADDLLSPDKIYNQVMLLEQNPGKLAVCYTIHFYDQANHELLLPSPYEKSFLFNDDDPVHFLINLWGGYTLNGGMITIHSWLTPGNIIDKAGFWNEGLTLDDDGEFFSRVILNSKGIIKSSGFSYYRKYSSFLNLSAAQNANAMASRLKSAIFKKKHLLSFTDAYAAKAAVYKSLINIAADCYLKYPAIHKQAMDSLPHININYQPPMGGKISDVFAAIFGWKTIKRLKQLLMFY